MAFIKDVCRWPDQAVCGVYLIPFFRLFQTSLNLSSSLSFPSFYSPLSVSLPWLSPLSFPICTPLFVHFGHFTSRSPIKPINRHVTDLVQESKKPYKSLEDRSPVFEPVKPPRYYRRRRGLHYKVYPSHQLPAEVV